MHPTRLTTEPRSPIPGPRSWELPRERGPLLDLILDNIPLAVFWKDLDLVYQGCNREFARDVGIADPGEIAGKSDRDLIWTPDQVIAWQAAERAVIETGTAAHHVVEPVIRADGVTIWVEVSRVPLKDQAGTVTGILGAYADVTERRRAQEALYESQQMLQLIMDNIPQRIFWKDRASVYMGCNINFARGAGLVASRAIVGKTDFELPWANEEAAWYREVDQRVMRNDAAEYHIMETQMQADGHRIWVDTNKVPLHDRDGRVVGILGTFEDVTERKRAQEALQKAHDELEVRVKERTAELRAINDQLQLEIAERRQVEATEHEQRTLAEALRDTAALLNSTLDLDQVLDRILSQIGRVVPHDTASIVLLDAGTVGVARYRGRVQERRVAGRTEARRYRLDELPTLRTMASTHAPLIISDTRTSANWVDLKSEERVRSYMGAPITFEGDVIGFINLNAVTPGFFQPHQAERLRAFADQAAIAIRNARLYEQAQAAAALEERQRLARDLHDAVSQTLWTVSLTADVLPELWERDVREGRRVLGNLRRLTRGALAEMRTLLLELRPAALSEANLDELLRQLAAATMSRKKIDVVVSVRGTRCVPVELKVALYRIAQEALNNVTKHARATRVAVDLVANAAGVDVWIRDNGRGFEVHDGGSDHLGLQIMRERAQAVGAQVVVASRPGHGTTIHVAWKDCAIAAAGGGAT